MDEYARRTVLANRQADKVMHGLAHLAVAALAFPRADDLGDDTYVGRVSVDQVDGAVREACRRSSERVAGTAEADPLSDAPQLEEVWRAWLRRPEATATKDGRAGEATTRGIVGKALRFLADQGFLVPVGQDGRLPHHAALPGAGARAGRRSGRSTSCSRWACSRWRGPTACGVPRVFELCRVRLFSVGPPGARYQDVCLDLRGVGAPVPAAARQADLLRPGRPGRRAAPTVARLGAVPGERRRQVRAAQAGVLGAAAGPSAGGGHDEHRCAGEVRARRGRRPRGAASGCTPPPGRLVVTGKVSEWPRPRRVRRRGPPGRRLVLVPAGARVRARRPAVHARRPPGHAGLVQGPAARGSTARTRRASSCGDRAPGVDAPPRRPRPRPGAVPLPAGHERRGRRGGRGVLVRQRRGVRRLPPARRARPRGAADPRRPRGRVRAEDRPAGRPRDRARLRGGRARTAGAAAGGGAGGRGGAGRRGRGPPGRRRAVRRDRRAQGRRGRAPGHRRRARRRGEGGGDRGGRGGTAAAGDHDGAAAAGRRAERGRGRAGGGRGDEHAGHRAGAGGRLAGRRAGVRAPAGDGRGPAVAPGGRRRAGTRPARAPRAAGGRRGVGGGAARDRRRRRGGCRGSGGRGGAPRGNARPRPGSSSWKG